MFVAGIALASQLVLAETTLKHDDFAGVTLYYKVITPKDYDPAKEYPAVIAFPGGAQTMPMVDGMIARNLAVQAQKRGYIVVVCAATAAGLFYQGGAVVFPAFLDKLLARLQDPREEVSHCGDFKRRIERIPHCCVVPEVFLVGDRVSRLSA